MFLLELSCLLKYFVDVKKKLLKLSFLVHPSNPGDSIQETDKDMNNIKIANLANPTDNEDATNKKYVDEKTETIDFFPFLSQYAGRSLFIETFIKKATCWYHTDYNSNSEIHHQNECHCFRSIRINQPCNTKQKISYQTENIFIK